ncbi:MAG: PLD nuclease N-terminal domain-containing protein [Dehalococcoidia bacterium]|nr:PLD nuclease N-terminal domain-containing protein [Dehalococcoidia bacterium]
MNDELTTGQLIALIIPLALVELGLLAFAIYDLIKRERVKGNNKWVWGILIMFVSIIGPILYLLLGREEE